MPAKKVARQQIKRGQRNRGVRTATRSGVARALRAMGTGDLEASEAAVTQAVSLLDQATRKGVVPKNTASRGKSRLSVRLNQLRETSAS
ncbi:MAG: 30S ribosomal protein S20 [SAR202 cluster bacterium Io17-Chloro-G9]|nr:MAG: 30S ribosomal protein S20 [SAR202 cluster bacterium Io17-Chloro-G9]